MLVLDNRTGAILALVGGFDFDRSQFDRAMQAKRQCGSAFKPFVYVAAFERGFSPDRHIFDGPVLLPDEKRRADLLPAQLLPAATRASSRCATRSSTRSTPRPSSSSRWSRGEAVDRRRAAPRHQARRSRPTRRWRSAPSSCRWSSWPPPTAGIANHGQVAEPYFIARVKDAEGKVICENRARRCGRRCARTWPT